MGTSVVEKLTPRQRDVFLKMVGGSTSKEIAFDLGLSPKTVDIHRSEVMKRLEKKNIVDLVKFAIREGVIQP